MIDSYPPLRLQQRTFILHEFHEKKNMALPDLFTRLPEFQAKAQFYVTEKDIEAVYKAAQYIKSDISVHRTHPQLAKVAGINECHLKRVFKLVFACTLYQYLFRERMLLAKELLSDPKKSIQDVAFACGYLDTRHFKKLLKKNLKHLVYIENNLRLD